MNTAYFWRFVRGRLQTGPNLTNNQTSQISQQISMEYLKNRVLKQQSPRATEEEVAIQTLSNRLQHATLAADRRSAVLGLKSFSRQFRESVVEYGLRPLLLTLDKDGDNPTMAKAILETLIILFLRGDKPDNDAGGWIANQSRFQNGKYPSPLLMTNVEEDQFSIWIADEVTSGENHLQVLTNILKDSQDYHIRLYTLQLFEFLVSTRATRTKECLINIPLAVPTIVSLLNDAYDPVRNEAILVLMALVNNNFNIQKLVAFENTFDRLFEIIDEEGGIRGSIVVQDCLTLLTNLLMYNASNQKYFLETEGIPKLAKLLAEPIEETLEDGMYDEEGNPILAPPIIWTEQRLQNMSIALEICKSFVNEDDPEIHRNQGKLFLAGIFFCTMRLVFSPLTENPIRKTALQITGDLIAGNSELQLQFSQIDVPYIDPSLPTQLQKFEGPIPAPVALLNWALLSNSVHIFEIRLAAVYCLRCFFKDNSESKIAFVTDQAKASQNPNFYDETDQPAPEDEEQLANGSTKGDEVASNATPTSEENTVKTPIANIFSTLMDFDFENKLNPYRVWFAATILIYLFEDCPENRQLARELRVGDAEEGEEVMSSIQAIAGILTTALDYQDPRIAIGLILLLTIWFYEDFDAVNDFLSDSSLIKSFVVFLSKNSAEASDLVLGMCSILVGISYEFTQKNSPVPRTEMHSLVTKGLGANNYALKVKQFKDCEEFREFTDPLSEEVERDSMGLPKVYFISNYVDLIKDNYYRIRKALSHSPLVEPHIKISYELLEELERKNGELATVLQECKDQAEQNETNYKAEIQKARGDFEESQALLQKSTVEVSLLRELEVEMTDKIETISSELKRIENEKSKFERDSEQYSAELNKISRQIYSNEGSLTQLKQKLADTDDAKTKAEDGINKMSRELFQLTREKKDLESKITKLEKEIVQLKSYGQKAVKDYESQLASVRKTNDELKAKIKILEQLLRELTTERENSMLRLRELHSRVNDAEAGNEHLMEKLRTAATVVQDLRSSNLEYNQQIEELKFALSNNVQNSQDNQRMQAELNSLRDRNLALASMINTMKDNVNQDSDSTQKSLLEALEEKSKHEISLKSLVHEIEMLKQDLSSESANLQHYQSSYQSAMQQLAVKEGEISQSNSRLEEMVSQVNSLTENVHKLREGEKLLQSQLLDKEQQISSVQNELREAAETASTLQSTLEKQLTNIRDQLTEHETTSNNAKDNYDKLRQEFDDLQVKYRQLVEVQDETTSMELSESVKEADKQEAEKLQNELQVCADLLLKKGQEIALAETKIANLEEELKGLSESAAKTKSELEKSLLESENKHEKLSLTIVELEKKHDQLITELESLKKVHSEELQALEYKFDEQLQHQSDSHASSQEALKNEYRVVLEKQNGDIQRAIADNDALKNEYESTRLVLQELQIKAASYEEAKSLAEQRASELHDTTASLQEELTVARNEKVDLEEKLHKLEGDLSRRDSVASSSHQNGTSDDGVKDVLTKEIASKISELMAKDQMISDIKRKLESSTIALEDLTERNEELEKAEKLRSQLEKKVQTLEADMEKAITLNDNLNQQLDDKTEELKQKLFDFKADTDSLKEEIFNHSGVEKELTKQIQSLEKELKKRVAEHEKDRKSFAGGAEPVLKQYGEQVENLEATIRSLKLELETQLKEVQASYDEKFSQLENEKQTFVSRCEELTNQLTAFETTRLELSANEKELQETIKQLKETLEEQEDQLRVKEVEAESLKSELAAKVEDLSKSHSALSEKESEFLSRDEQSTSSLNQLEDELRVSKEEIASKQLEIRNLMFEIESMTSDAESQKQKVSELSSHIHDNSKIKSELEKKVSNLNDVINSLQEKLEKSSSIVEEKTAEILKLDSKLKAVLADFKVFEEHQRTLKALEAEISDLKQKLNEMQNENKELIKRSTEVNDQHKISLEKWESDEKTLKEKLSIKVAEVEKLTSEISSVRAERAKLEKDNTQFKTRLENNALSKAQLESEIRALSNEMEVKSLSDSEQTKRIAMLESRAKESDDLVFDLKTKLGDYVEEKMDMESHLEKCRSECEKLEYDVQSLLTEKKKVSLRLEAQEHLVKDLQTSEQKMSGDVSTSKKQIENLESKLKLETKSLEDASKTLAETARLLETEKSEREKAKSQNESLAKELEKLKKEHLAEKQHWETLSAESNLETSKLQKELSGEKTKLESTERELQSAQQGVANLTSEITQARENDEHQALNEQIALLKEQLAAKERVEADFEDLVLLWEEQEKKMLRYKTQLISLDQYQSSDEDESDDDDEES